MNNPTKKQHYVPRKYLRKWCDEDDAFYPIKVESKNPAIVKVFDKVSNPERFCFENFFYAQKTGEKDEFSQIVEKDFTDAENSFWKQLPDIESKILNNKQISPDEKWVIASFGIMLWLRGKKYREWSNDMSENLIKWIMKTHMQMAHKDPKFMKELKDHGITQEEMIEFADKEEYKVEVNNSQSLRLFESYEKFSNLLFHKYWIVYISRDGKFITSDSPYLDIPKYEENPTIYGQSFLARNQYIILSPKILIECIYPNNKNGKKFKRIDITGKIGYIHHLNSIMLMNANQFGFHPNNQNLKDLEKWINFVDKNKDLFKTKK